MKKKIVVLGFLGTNLDQGGKPRWGRWRPTISLGQQDDLLVDRFELFYEKNFLDLAQLVQKDFQQVSPETELINRIQSPRSCSKGSLGFSDSLQRDLRQFKRL